MKFVDVEIVTGEDGKTVVLPVNPKQVTMLRKTVIPTGLEGAGGVSITKPGTAICLAGGPPIPVVGEINEIRKLLEGNTKPSNYKIEK